MGGITSVIARGSCRKPVKVVIVGTQGGGRTTLLYKLFLGFDFALQTIPTIGFNVENINYKNITFTMYDCGGGDKARALWVHYFHGIQVMMCVADCSDRDSIQPLRDDLLSWLSHKDAANVLLLIYANKQDVPNAVNREELIHELNLESVRHKWHVQESCALDGRGINEGLEWIKTSLNY